MIQPMIVYPDIDPIIFSIGVVKIRWYGLMYVVGFLFAWWLVRKRSQAAHSVIKNLQQADDLIFYGMLGVILGGRIGHALFYSSTSFADDPLYLFKIWEGGMSFHGGLIGVLVAMWLFGRKLKLRMWQVADFVAPVTPLGLGFGRIGNFINGELRRRSKASSFLQSCGGTRQNRDPTWRSRACSCSCMACSVFSSSSFVSRMPTSAISPRTGSRWGRF